MNSSEGMIDYEVYLENLNNSNVQFLSTKIEDKLYFVEAEWARKALRSAVLVRYSVYNCDSNVASTEDTDLFWKCMRLAGHNVVRKEKVGLNYEFE